MIKVSVIIPVKNEADSIAELLDSLEAQSVPIDEIVIVDAGSTDKTVAVIGQYMPRLPIKLIRLKEALPGKGRNAAILSAKNEVVAAIDCGCVAKKGWFEELIRTFVDQEADAVFGTIEPAARNFLQKCMMFVTFPDKAVPWSASMVFKKEIWKSAGGFAENLRNGEDTVFIKKITQLGCRIKYSERSLICWYARPTLASFWIQNYQYGNGEGRLKIRAWFYIRKTIFYSILIAVCVAVSGEPLLSLFSAISGYALWVFITLRMQRRWFQEIVSQPKTYLLLPLVLLVRDISGIIGFVTGTVQGIIAPLNISYCQELR